MSGGPVPRSARDRASEPGRTGLMSDEEAERALDALITGALPAVCIALACAYREQPALKFDATLSRCSKV